MSGEASKIEAAEMDLLRLDMQVCFALYSASNRVTRLYRPLLEPLGLTYLQYVAMMLLWENSPQTLGALGDRLGLDSGTLTPLFKRMEKAGLVTRTRDPGDERRLIVALTEPGRALKARAAEVPAALFCQIPIPVQDMTALKESLDRLVCGLNVAAAKI